MSATFFASAGILFREGREAILVLVALAAYLSRIGAADRVRALWTGASLAVVASVGTAWVFEHFYNGAHSDVFEVVLILISAALLFYVSGWLFLKQDPRAWRVYLTSQTDKAVAADSTLAIAILAFFAVAREGGETILFFHTLVSTSGGWSLEQIAGILASTLLLAIVSWLSSGPQGTSLCARYS